MLLGEGLLEEFERTAAGGLAVGLDLTRNFYKFRKGVGGRCIAESIEIAWVENNEPRAAQRLRRPALCHPGSVGRTESRWRDVRRRPVDSGERHREWNRNGSWKCGLGRASGVVS